MKINIGNWKVDLSTFINIEWRKPFPKLIVHEKYEKYIKWSLRILTAIGILASLLSLPPLYSLSLSVAIFLIGQFFERIVFEYTVFIVQPFPDFKIQYDQWFSNGYLFPNPDFKTKYSLENHFGPVFKEKEYATKFFTYLKSWNQGSDDDIDNNICISIILENNSSYTTYLYANPNRKWLDEIFNQYREEIKYDKYGKNQQSMIMQMIYGKNLKVYDNSLFHQFVEEQKEDQKFYFVPFHLENNQIKHIEEVKISKYKYQLRKREDLTENDIEYFNKPGVLKNNI